MIESQIDIQIFKSVFLFRSDINLLAEMIFSKQTTVNTDIVDKIDRLLILNLQLGVTFATIQVWDIFISYVPTMEIANFRSL